mgnify:CR=1 FL=1
MMSKKIIVVIPARYGSSRFPGKPLATLAGKSMLKRVHDIALKAIEGNNYAQVIVSTEDKRIKEHAEAFGANVIMTSDDCETGSDRALNACTQLNDIPDIVINFQGDAPLTPPSFLQAIIQTLMNNTDIDVATPIIQMDWQSLDTLRARKLINPFSGTTAITDKHNNALWFSKNIIPAMRNEAKLRQTHKMSPVYKHVGLYGYQFKALQKFVRLPIGHYEALEGLEQLRMIESGMTIKTVNVSYADFPSMSGVDTKEDLAFANTLIEKHGDPMDLWNKQ